MLSIIRRKLQRAREAATVIRTYGADAGSRAGLLRAYLRTLRSTTDPEEIAIRLRLGAGVHPLRMRLSDIFTLDEILLQQQYRLRSSIPQRPTIIDAGANIGVAAVWLLAQYPGAEIHAFEPDPENHRLLSANLAHNSSARSVQAAVASEDGRLTLHLAPHGAEHSIVAHSSGGQSIQVDAIALGPYLERHGIQRVDLLKLDVEGSELDALRGLGDRIESVSVIVGEFHEHHVDEREFYGYLESHGFRQVRRIRYPGGESIGVHTFEVARIDAD